MPGAGREDSDGNEIASESQTGAVHLMTYGLRLERTEHVRAEALEVADNEYRLAHGARGA